MAKASIPLYVGPGGINRDISDDSKQAFLEGMDVWAPRNGVQSRPSFKVVSAGPQELFPCGRVVTAQGAGPTHITTHRLSASGNNTWYVGCLDPFDGVNWGGIVGIPSGSPTSHKRVLVDYQSAPGVWTPLTLVSDTTILLDTSGAFSESLAKAGALHWRRPASWVVTTLSPITGSFYYIRIRLVNLRTQAPVAPEFAWTLVRPGVRAFTRSPLGAVIRLQAGPNLSLGLVSRRTPARAYEAGSRLSRWGLNTHIEPHALSRQVRRAAGRYGTYVPWAPYLASAGGPGSSLPTVGVADTIQDGAQNLPPFNNGSKDRYNYTYNQPYGAVLVDGAVAGIGGTGSTFVLSGLLFTSFPGSRSLEGAWIQATSGSNTGQVREISDYTASATPSITVSDPFGSAVAFGDTFRIIAPPSNVMIDEAGQVEFPIMGPASDLSFPVAASSGLDSFPTPANYMSGGPCAFRIMRPLHADIRGQETWTSVYDPIAKTTIIATGDSTLEWDGDILKEAEADVSSAFALSYLDLSKITTSLDPASIYSSEIDRMLFAKIPPGKAIGMHRNTIFLLDPDGYTVYYSLPGDAKKVWPKEHIITVATPGAPIEGMISYGDSMILYSREGIYEVVEQANSRARFDIKQVITGTGLSGISGATIAPLSGTVDMVIGVHAGGVRAYSAGTVVSILDAWDSLVDGSVDVTNAVAATWRQEGCVLFGLTQIGRPYQDLIVVYDYVNKAFWTWRAPFGVRSIHVIQDINGREVVLIGTEEGTLCTLTEFQTPEDSFEGFIQTRFVKAKDGTVMRPSLISITTLNNNYPTMNIQLFADQRSDPWLSGNYPTRLGESEYGIATYGSADWADKIVKIAMVNVPSGMSARQISVRVAMLPLQRVEAITVDAGSINKRVR